MLRRSATAASLSLLQATTDPSMAMATRMRMLFSACIILLLSCFLASVQGQNSSCAPGQLRVAGFGQTLNYVVADQQGFFAQEGLSLCFTQVIGSVAQFTDFQAGKYDLLSSATDNFVNRFVNENLPLQIFLAGDENEGIEMIGRAASGILSVPDLAGKAFLVDAVDSGYSFTAQYILSVFGLHLNRDYTLVPVGGTFPRLNGLTLGSGYGAMITPGFSYDIPRLTNGTCQTIADFKRLWAPRKYSQLSWAADRGWLAANQDTLQRFLRAYIRAGQYILNPANKQAVVAMLAQSNGITNLAAQQYFEDSLGRYDQAYLGKIDRHSIQGAIDLRNMFGGFQVAVDSDALIKESLHQGLITSVYWGRAYEAVRT